MWTHLIVISIVTTAETTVSPGRLKSGSVLGHTYRYTHGVHTVLQEVGYVRMWNAEVINMAHIMYWSLTLYSIG